jgi:hypothetical protein
MNMELGELREPIAPLYNSKTNNWNGIIRVHFKYVEANGNALLEGLRIFALELDEETTITKVSRGFDSIASNNNLTLKISNKSLSQFPTHKLFEIIVKDSFRRNKEFEITQVLKGIDHKHAYVSLT